MMPCPQLALSEHRSARCGTLALGVKLFRTNNNGVPERHCGTAFNYARKSR